jgi:hypothetical protein
VVYCVGARLSNVTDVRDTCVGGSPNLTKSIGITPFAERDSLKRDFARVSP